MSQVFNDFLVKWHKVVEDSDNNILDELLHDDVIFYSPVVHTPQRGKFITKMYLMGAGESLKDEFKYQKKIIDGLHGVLEFSCMIDDISVEGVDIIELNEDGKVINFKVMVRPLKAVHKIHERMGEMLEKLKGK